jgi:pyruvate dehydrogenase E2 component (dihydrolipoyllysine-residue acetyltransferase)
MPVQITVPRLGWTMEEGTFVSWLKQEGEYVRAGEPLFTLEGEKAVQDVEATDSGVLRIAPGSPSAGKAVRVGALLGYLLADGEAMPAPQSTAPEAAPPLARTLESVPEAAFPPVPVPEARRGPASDRRPAISPRALRVARELGIDWSRLNATGRHGRIRERDVRAAAVNRSRLTGRTQPVSARRRAIARRMSAGVHEAAPVTLGARAEAAALVGLLEQLKSVSTPDRPGPGLTALLVKLAAAALQRHPLLNAQWREDGIFLPDHINVAVAVDTEEGVLAPVIRDVPALTLAEVAAACRSLVGKARAGELAEDDMQDGTFTLTNLGAGTVVDTFTPILNLPQCAILGVGCLRREPVVRGEAVVPGQVLPLSLTFDHRLVDGGPAGRFLETVRRLIEDPTGLGGLGGAG